MLKKCEKSANMAKILKKIHGPFSLNPLVLNGSYKTHRNPDPSHISAYLLIQFFEHTVGNCEHNELKCEKTFPFQMCLGWHSRPEKFKKSRLKNS